MLGEYAFDIHGRVSARTLAELPGFTASEHGGLTRLVGPVRDQAELDGIAARLRDAGYRIIAMAPVDGRTNHPG